MAPYNLDHRNIGLYVPRAQTTSVTTTAAQGGSTIVALPDATVPQAPFPVGAVVGGTCGGVALVVMAVIIWKWWGICIRNDVIRYHKKRRMRQLAAAQAKRSAVTMPEKNGGPKVAAHSRPSRPKSLTPNDKKVSFAPASVKPALKTQGNGHISTSPPTRTLQPSAPRPLAGNKLQRPRHARTPSRGSRTYSPIRPSPLGRGSMESNHTSSTFVSPSVPPLPSDAKIRNTESTEKSSADAPQPAIPIPPASAPSSPIADTNNPTQRSETALSSETLVSPTPRSNVANVLANGVRRISSLTRSSGSVYSRTSSGEEISRRWSWLFIAPPSIMGGRNSFINRSSGTSSSPTNASSRIQVGYAYGGDEFDDYEDNGFESDINDLDSEEQFFDCEDDAENDSHV